MVGGCWWLFDVSQKLTSSSQLTDAFFFYAHLLLSPLLTSSHHTDPKRNQKDNMSNMTKTETSVAKRIRIIKLLMKA